MRKQIYTSADYRKSQWSGGNTTEVMISPPNASYADRTFDFRISSATVDLEESTFSDLTGIQRRIMLLEGEMHLEHDGKIKKTVEQYEAYSFDGAWKTVSRGKCTDFNLMLGDGWDGELACASLETPAECTTEKATGFYCLMDNVKVFIICDEETRLAGVMNKGDFLFIESNQKKQSYRVSLEKEGTKPSAPAAVMTTAWKK